MMNPCVHSSWRCRLTVGAFFRWPDKYDKLCGAAGWARDSLAAHANDQREWTYSVQELEEAKTHEDIWNAAQLQLVRFVCRYCFFKLYFTCRKKCETSESCRIHGSNVMSVDGLLVLLVFVRLCVAMIASSCMKWHSWIGRA